MRKHILSLLVVLALLLSACSGTPVTKNEPISITDLAGVTFTFDAPPTKVIAIDPAMCEIIYALGAQDALVAVGDYCDYPPEVSEKTTVGAYNSLNIEELIAMEPDCIIIGTMSTSPEQVEALNNANVKTMALEPQTIDDVYGTIETMGLLLGKEDSAKTVIADMKKSLDDIAQKGAALAEKPGVYIEISPLSDGLYTTGTGTFQHELIQMVGGENVFGQESSWVPVSEEQVIERNPAVIISTTQYEGYDPVTEISTRSGWETISAVENGQVFYIDPSILSHPSPRLVEGAQAVYDALAAQ